MADIDPDPEQTGAGLGFMQRNVRSGKDNELRLKNAINKAERRGVAADQHWHGARVQLRSARTGRIGWHGRHQPDGPHLGMQDAFGMRRVSHSASGSLGGNRRLQAPAKQRDVNTAMAAENVAARASWDAADHLRNLHEMRERAEAARAD